MIKSKFSICAGILAMSCSAVEAAVDFHTISGATYGGFQGIVGVLAAPEIADDGTVLLHQGANPDNNFYTWRKDQGLSPVAGDTPLFGVSSGWKMSNDSRYLLFSNSFESGLNTWSYHTPSGIKERGQSGISGRGISHISGDGKTLYALGSSLQINIYKDGGVWEEQNPGQPDDGVNVSLTPSSIRYLKAVNHEGDRVLLQNGSTSYYFVDILEDSVYAATTHIPVQFQKVVAMSDDGSTVLGLVQGLNPGCSRTNVIYSEQDGLTEINCSTEYTVTDISGDGSKVIGYSATDQTSYVWDAESGLKDLKPILLNNGFDLSAWSRFNVTDISRDGTKIAGFGTDGDGDDYAFMMEVVPECTLEF